MTIARTGETFEMGRVLSRAFGAIGRNFGLFLGLALILAGIPHLLTALWRVSAQDPSHPGGAPAIIALVAGSLLGLVSGAILQVAITRATVTDLVGEKPAFGACLKAGLALILPMIGLSILAGLGVGLAMILLIIPGIMLFVAWSVAVPAYVQERIGITDSLGRSRALTKGARWKIFGLFLVYAIAVFILNLPVGFMVAGFHASPYLAVAFSSLVSVLGTMVLVTMQATMYVELRDVKEGVSPKELEAIFA